MEERRFAMVGIGCAPSHRIKYAGTCGLLLATVACAPLQSVSTAGVPPVAANMSRIWFYQQGTPSDGVGVAAIRLNGGAVGQSMINAGFYRDVAPGHYQVSLDAPKVSEPNQTADLEVSPGQVTYVKVATLDNWDASTGCDRGGGTHTTFYLWPVTATQGSVEVALVNFYGG
jgi:hypothetical protein